MKKNLFPFTLNLNFWINFLIFCLINTICFYGILGIFEIFDYKIATFVVSSSIFVILFFSILDYIIKILLYYYLPKTILYSFSLIIYVFVCLIFLLTDYLIVDFMFINLEILLGFSLIFHIIRQLILYLINKLTNPNNNI
jgi:hypothetical protein